MGLIGINGSGKSTLLRLISGELTTETGYANMRGKLTIGYLPQEPRFSPEHTLLQEALTAHTRLFELERSLAEVEEQMGQPEVYSDEKRLSRKLEEHAALLDEHTRIGGPGYQGQVRSTLLNLGFAEHELNLPVANLSGGQKKLLGLTKLLVTRPDILLLDEPDNHLDMAGKEFLEQYIRSYPGGVVLISHDRFMLDVVADEIAELRDGKVTVYEGNYSEYVALKEAKLLEQQRQFKVQQNELSRLEQSAKRMLIWGRSHENEKLIRRAKSMMKRIEKMDKVEKPKADPRAMSLQFKGWRGSNKVLELTEIAKGFDGPGGWNQVLDGLDLTLWHGERVGLVGPNGAGKSVLFRLLLGREQPEAGEIKVGPSIQTGYYAQEHETLDHSMSLMETVRRAANLSEANAVKLLDKFVYEYQRMNNPVGTLSGGERSRLQLILIMLSGANFLLLDEPTNNLDIRSAEVLEDSLTEFEGSMLAISHDRYFLDRVATRIVELEDGKLVEYPGGYSDYQAAKAKLEI